MKRVFNYFNAILRRSKIVTSIPVILVIIFVSTLFFTARNSQLAEKPTQRFQIPSNGKMVIYYNRVPKCGSTTTRTLFKIISKQENTFKFISSDIFDTYSLSIPDQEKLRQTISTSIRETNDRVWVFDRHIYFIDFGSTSNLTFHYINQVRNPLTAAISGYGFALSRCDKYKVNCDWRFSDPTIKTMTLEKCIHSIEPMNCIFGNHGAWSPLPFFCGQHIECLYTKNNTNRDLALTMAKKNIEKYYTFIGVLEYIENSFELFEYTYPTIFKGINKAYRKISKQKRVNKTPEKFRQTISNASIEKLRQLLKHEFDLYHFIVQRFTRSYYQAFNKMPVSAQR